MNSFQRYTYNSKFFFFLHSLSISPRCVCVQKNDIEKSENDQLLTKYHHKVPKQKKLVFLSLPSRMASSSNEVNMSLDMEFEADAKQDKDSAKKIKQRLKQHQKLQADSKACLDSGRNALIQLTIYSNQLNLQMVECQKLHSQLQGPSSDARDKAIHQITTQWNRITLRWQQVTCLLDELKAALIEANRPSQTKASIAHLATLCISADERLKKRDRSTSGIDTSLKRLASKVTSTNELAEKPKRKRQKIEHKESKS